MIKKLKQSGDKFHLCDHEFKNDFITTILDEFNVSYIVLLFHELRKYHNDDRYNNFYKEYQEIKKILQYIVDEDINLEINNLKKRFSYLLNNYLNFSETKKLLLCLLQQPVSRFENVEEKKRFYNEAISFFKFLFEILLPKPSKNETIEQILKENYNIRVNFTPL